MRYPSAPISMNYKGSWKELAVPLHPEEGNPDTDKPWEAAAGAYLLGRMNGWETFQGAEEIQYSGYETFTLVEGLMKRLPKGWWGNRGQERNRGRQPFLQGMCSSFFSHQKIKTINFTLPISMKDQCRYKILWYSLLFWKERTNLPALYLF